MATLSKYKLALSLILCLSIPAHAKSPIKVFDQFGDLNCEEESARLDNFAIHLQKFPQSRGLVIFYGGRRFRGKLPVRGEAAARAARMRPYLVDYRKMPASQLFVIDGGYKEERTVDLWIVPPGVSMPRPNPTVAIKDIKFRPGTISSRSYSCRVARK